MVKWLKKQNEIQERFKIITYTAISLFLNQSMTIVVNYYDSNNPYTLWSTTGAIFSLNFLFLIGMILDGLWDLFGFKILIRYIKL